MRSPLARAEIREAAQTPSRLMHTVRRLPNLSRAAICFRHSNEFAIWRTAGPYEIIAPLGAGGMGEVYKARDPRLGRAVAIKVLPAEFSTDAKLRLRFEREARAISSLNHPHICSVYDIGHEEGRDYLVMEHIDGETLSQRLARGALPIEQVLRYGIEIADALDKAHRQGIIHRDLKPSNVMITKSGAKLLDFGLAKAQHGSIWEQATSKVSQLPTAQRRLTAEGTLVGTLQYMAPEQLEGKEADARTDIFALGGVLYRMATGKRPFEGESDASLIAAILEREPKPLTELQPLTPAALDRLVRSCLNKDPDERIQAAHDVLLELRWISEGVSHPSLQMPIYRRTPRWWIGAVLAAAGIAALITWQAMKRQYAPTRAERIELQPPPGMRIGASAQSTLAISPDGEWVAFFGGSDEPDRSGIYLRRSKELGARLISAGGVSPFFSPDSQWLAFAAEGYLQKVPLSGGEPRRICEVRELNVRGASWGDDGTIVFALMKGLRRVSAEGGKPEVLTEPPPGQRHRWPHVLPGSRAVLFVIHRGFSDSWRDVAVISLKDRKIQTLALGTSPRYAGGQLIYSHLGVLHSAPFDLRRLKLKGQPKPVLEDVSFHQGTAVTGFDVSASGSLVYIPGAHRLQQTELVWIDREGRVVSATNDRRNYDSATVSPDGKRFAAVIRASLEDSDLWIYETEERRWARLTFGKRVNALFGNIGSGPIWTFDARWIVFTSFERSGIGRLARVRSDGSAPPEPLTSGANQVEYPGGVSPDGTIVFMGQDDDTHYNLLTMPINGGAEKTFLATPTEEAWPVFSPDGRWIAYESSETDTREIHVRPYPGPGPRVTVSTSGGRVPFWSRDGRELYYRRGKELWAAQVITGESFKAGRPRMLFRADWLLAGWEQSIDVALDGRFLAVRHPPESSPERRLVYIPRWIDEQKVAARVAR